MAEPILFERLVVGPLGVNCYLYGDPDSRDAVCIDPGSEGLRIVSRAKEQGLRVLAVLITHAHADHIVAAHDVADAFGAPVLAPDGEQDLWALASEFCTLWGFTVPQPPPPDEWFTPGSTLRFGPIEFDTLDVRGHSPAGVAYSAPGIVFTGDALFADSIGRTDLPGQDHLTLIDRIRRNLLSLPPNTIVYPGHGPKTTIGREARSNPFLLDHGPG
ncbi:MAG TPA: MBL fold metallo-hydrolase [Armatimonadota bacterium]|jgi:glyoxylase-like metal-dependent hydrolase (beta-lactamase superfamily II)